MGRQDDKDGMEETRQNFAIEYDDQHELSYPTAGFERDSDRAVVQATKAQLDADDNVLGYWPVEEIDQELVQEGDDVIEVEGTDDESTFLFI